MLILTVVSFVALSPMATLPLQYKVVRMQPANGRLGTARDVNARGYIVGDFVDYKGSRNSFVYKSGTFHTISSIPGAYAMLARSINTSGDVVGTAEFLKLPSLAFLWKKGKTRPLGRSQSTGTNANGINDSGAVVGDTGGAKPENSHAILWTSGETQLLPALGQHSRAVAINALSQIVGWDGTRAIIWKDGVQHQLPGFGAGHNDQAMDINDSGWIVGTAWIDANHSHAFLLRDGSMTDLGSLPGFRNSVANGINNSGDTVGTSFGNYGPDKERAFLWKAGQIYNLNALMTNPKGWTLEGANAINDRGVIVGRGIYKGEVTAFMLTPVRLK